MFHIFIKGVIIMTSEQVEIRMTKDQMSRTLANIMKGLNEIEIKAKYANEICGIMNALIAVKTVVDNNTLEMECEKKDDDNK